MIAGDLWPVEALALEMRRLTPAQAKEARATIGLLTAKELAQSLDVAPEAIDMERKRFRRLVIADAARRASRRTRRKWRR